MATTPTVTSLHPAYELTVRNFFAAIIESKTNGVPTFGEKLYNLAVVKKIGLAPDASSKKIYASGSVYDTTDKVTGGKITLGVVALPRELTDSAMGVEAVGGQSVDVQFPQKKELLIGFSAENSDGSMVYQVCPRCKLNTTSEDHTTSDDGDLDPEVSYELEILPTEEGVWRGRYYTKDVPTGKTPFTAEEYVSKLPYTKAQFAAIPGSESAVEA